MPAGNADSHGELVPGTRSDVPTLENTPGTFSIAYPHQFGSFVTQAPFFYEDDTRTFLVVPFDLDIGNTGEVNASNWLSSGQGQIRPEIIDAIGQKIDEEFEPEGGFTFTPTVASDFVYRVYRFEIFYHPYACLLIGELNRHGIDGLLDPKPDGEASALRRQLKRTPFYQTTYDSTEHVNVPYPVEEIDFSYGGAYSLYNWELFFHAPFLIANRLNQNQRFEEAQKWFHYVFDPTWGATPGLSATYFDNQNLTGPGITPRVDPTVDFNWGTGSPDPAIGPDTFSVRWTGQVQPEHTETYTFYTRTDDGVRLWVNGDQLINRWVDQAPTEHSGTIDLEAGKLYDLTMEYYENMGGAVAQLMWSSPSTPKAVIPRSRLYAEAAPARFWKVKPFYEAGKGQHIQELMLLLGNTGSEEEQQKLRREIEAQVDAWRKEPFKPHLIARMRHTAYQKAVVIKYLDNLIAWGDHLFLRDTIESINEATQLYVLAAEILGDRPREIPAPEGVPTIDDGEVKTELTVRSFFRRFERIAQP